MKQVKYFALCLLMASCSGGVDNKAVTGGSQDDTNTQQSVINGHFENAQAKTITLQRLHSSSVENLGTDTIGNDGTFIFNPGIEGFGFFRLFIDQSNNITVLMKAGEHLNVTGNLDDLYGTYKVSGSESAQGLWDLNDILRFVFTARDSLAMVMQTHKMNSDFSGYSEAQEAISKLQKQMTERIHKLIDANPAALSNLAAIENLDPAEDYTYYKLVADTLFSLYGNHELIQNLRTRVEKMGRLAIGAIVPDLVVNDVNGNALQLSSLRGKVVLLDFWASWCKPCRAENPNVVAAYNRFHDKGFDVFSVSLDGLPNQSDPEMAWKQAIKQDGLIWPNHGSELQGWNSSFIQTFNISGIPFSILIDRDGKIIAKELRGPALHEKLTEILEHAKT